MPQSLAGHSVARERLIREASTASKLSHPNIATIYEVDEVEGQVLVSMEYISGQSLAQRLRGGPLPIEEVVRIGSQAAEALAAAHDHGVIHRDIKPANVLITDDGQVKVVDFGLALEVSPPKDTSSEETIATAAARLTRSGSAVGTVAYMSPEQARGDATDARTDLFSLGVMLYEMSTGVLPFQGHNPLAMAAAIIHDPPIPFPDAATAIPAGLKEIVLRCLNKNPDLRPSSAILIKEALGLLREGHSTGNIRQVLGRRPWRIRAFRGAGIAALVVAAGLVGFWISRPPEVAPMIENIEAQRAFDQARQYESRGSTLTNLNLGEQMYRKALELEPGNRFLEAHLARFLAYSEMAYPGHVEGRLDEIRKLSGDLIEADAGLAPAWAARARLHLIEGDAEGAVESAEKVIALDREWHEGHILLGVALIDQGDVETGLDRLRGAIDVGEGLSWARAQLATELYDLGRTDEAAAEYRKALDLAPDSPVALNNLGVIYLGRGNYVEAIGLFKRRLEIQPDEFAASNLGFAYFVLGQMNDAIDAFHDAVDLAPGDAVIKQNLAETYEETGDVETAHHWYGEALNTYDENLARMGEAQRGTTLAERAFCAAKLGRLQEALANIDEALTLTPDDMNSLRSAARVQAMAGNREQAYRFIRRAVAAGYPGEEIRTDRIFRDYSQDAEFLRLLTDPES